MADPFLPILRQVLSRGGEVTQVPGATPEERAANFQVLVNVRKEELAALPEGAAIPGVSGLRRMTAAEWAKYLQEKAERQRKNKILNTAISIWVGVVAAAGAVMTGMAGGLWAAGNTVFSGATGTISKLFGGSAAAPQGTAPQPSQSGPSFTDFFGVPRGSQQYYNVGFTAGADDYAVADQPYTAGSLLSSPYGLVGVAIAGLLAVLLIRFLRRG